MKRFLLIAVLLITAALSYGQLYYKGWQIKDPMYGCNYTTSYDFISFESLGKGAYKIIGWGENKKSVIFKVIVAYVAQENEDYVYKGVMSYGKLNFDTIILKTGIKLSDYSGAKSVSLYNTIYLLPQYKNDKGEWDWFRMFKLTLLG